MVDLCFLNIAVMDWMIYQLLLVKCSVPIIAYQYYCSVLQQNTMSIFVGTIMMWPFLVVSYGYKVFLIAVVPGIIDNWFWNALMYMYSCGLSNCTEPISSRSDKSLSPLIAPVCLYHIILMNGPLTYMQRRIKYKRTFTTNCGLLQLKGYIILDPWGI